MFKPLDATPNFPQLEEETLSYWKENKTFEKSLQIREKSDKWNFVDGPPFVTGMPHYGTLLSSIPKDLFPRYWTMKGYYVRRVWGWDGHGLPIENKVEIKLGIKRKTEIETKVGVKKFIEECFGYVNEVSGEWEWYVNHIARWVDFQNAYKTWDIKYMESVMWVFKQMYDKGNIYKGMRVSLYCPHDSTPISNFEVAMDADNYQMVTEAANTYKYKLKDEDNTYLLAWSTTPWNKIATNALAVNPKLDYIKVKENNEFYILAKGALKMLKSESYEVVEEFKGEKLVGKIFEPHYTFFKVDPEKRNFVVIPGDFVTEVEGTGVVTIAAYGEEDMAAMKKENIQIVLHVDNEGRLISDVTPWAGMNYLKVNPLVNEDLEKRGLMYKEEEISHSVPTCWRCHTRLYYAPQDAWYVNIQGMKDKLKTTNETVNWVPSHFKYGRFLKSMESAPDWCISRSRYWGSPVPVWECKCGERFVPGSIAELEEASGLKIIDLHKPGIDGVEVICKKCGKKAHRVPEVLDSWIEAGSAPYAERHFPFDKTIDLKDFFPPDFIVEYTGQIRAWFYVLHVISTALYGSNAFKNVVVTGVILGTDGRKMSKNFGNYPDPKLMIQKYGGDALRLYLMGSTVMQGEDLIISETAYRDQIKVFLIPLWNIVKYFTMYANMDGWKKTSLVQTTNVLDRWALSLTHSLIKEVTSDLDAYDTMSAVTKLIKFVDDISKWYIRRSRDRVGPTAEDQADRDAFYATCYQMFTVVLKVSAPIAPFISEYLYRNLTEEESVHLLDWPKVEESQIDTKLEEAMEIARKVTEEGHGKRKLNNIKVRIPIGELFWQTQQLQEQLTAVLPEIWDVVLKELNAKNILITEQRDEKTSFTYPNPPIPFTEEQLQHEGELRDLVREIQSQRKNLNRQVNDLVNVTVPNLFKADMEFIKKKVLAKNIQLGDRIEVTT